MVPQFAPYPQEGPNTSGPSNMAPSWPRPAYVDQAYMCSEIQNTFSMSGRGPSAYSMNGPIVHQFTPSLPYMTGSESDPVGDDGTVSTFFLPPPNECYEWQTMWPLHLMHPPSCIAGPSYSDSDNRREIPIVVVAGRQEVVPVSSASPPTYPPSGPPGPIPGAQDSTASRSESTGDTPGSASPTSLPIPHMQRTPSSGSYHTFIDGTPVPNKLCNLAKEKVASHPIVMANNLAKERVASPSIVMASHARRTNPVRFICDYCQATFTRGHNHAYHVDAHLGRKKHSSLCGKKFSTRTGSKRHQNTCSECQGISKAITSALI